MRLVDYLLDIHEPNKILWSDGNNWYEFGEIQPPHDGYYQVVWENGDAPKYIYLRKLKADSNNDIKCKYSWQSNPWVWVIEFKVLEPNQ